MTIEEYKAFLKEGSPFFKFDSMIGHRAVSYVIYAKKLGEPSKFNDRYVVDFESCCYLYTDYRGHKSFTVSNTNRLSAFIDGISKASECDIRELYKHLKHYGYQRK